MAGSATTSGSVAVAGSVLTFFGIAIKACIATIGCVGLRGVRAA